MRRPQPKTVGLSLLLVGVAPPAFIIDCGCRTFPCRLLLLIRIIIVLVVTSTCLLLVVVLVAPTLSLLLVVVAHSIADCFFLFVFVSPVLLLSLYTMYYI